MIDMDNKKIKKTIILGILAIIVALILNEKCPPSYAVHGGITNPNSFEAIYFGNKQPTYDNKLYMAGKVTSGSITVYVLDGVFDVDNNFTEEDIIEKHIIEQGEYNLFIYIGDTSPYHKKTVWIEYSKDYEYAKCRLVTSSRRKVIEYIIEALIN